jgi:nucleoside-diphosphate-sugar epimerase
METEFFVTGGTGFIGCNLIPRLLRQYPESKVTVLIRPEEGRQ